MQLNFTTVKIAFSKTFFTGISLPIIALLCVSFVQAKTLNPLQDSAVVSNLKAEYRNGQVFLMWHEGITNEQNMRIYISAKPITSQTFKQAKLLTDQLEPHSADDWYEDSTACPRAKGPMHGWIIEPNLKPLERSNGLFVHTVLGTDAKQAYFAVLSYNQTARNLKPNLNTTTKPLNIKVAPIQAIWQLAGIPPTATGKALAVYLHSHLSRPSGQLTYLFFGDRNMGWREGLPFKFKVTVKPNAVLLEPYDRVWINRKMSMEEAKPNGTYDARYKNIESWWYGTNNHINNPALIASGTPTNYTERWILWAMNWVQQQYGTNPNQVYAFGASMGTGILRMVLKNPNRFASVDLLVPILDPFGEGNVGARMAPRVGRPESICSDGMPLRERLNTIHTIEDAKTGLAPMLIRVGRSDVATFWLRKPPFMQAAQNGKQQLLVGWDNGTHATAMRKPLESFPNWFNFNWYIDHYAINQSYPVFTHCSLDDNPGNGQTSVGDTTGYINHGVDWKLITDSATSYKMVIKINHERAVYPAYVDITPRRCQQFKPYAKSSVFACNIDANGKVIERKKLVADADGLLTFPKFTITSAAGNTLVLEAGVRVPSSAR